MSIPDLLLKKVESCQKKPIVVNSQSSFVPIGHDRARKEIRDWLTKRFGGDVYDAPLLALVGPYGTGRTTLLHSTAASVGWKVVSLDWEVMIDLTHKLAIGSYATNEPTLYLFDDLDSIIDSITNPKQITTMINKIAEMVTKLQLCGTNVVALAIIINAIYSSKTSQPTIISKSLIEKKSFCKTVTIYPHYDSLIRKYIQLLNKKCPILDQIVACSKGVIARAHWMYWFWSLKPSPAYKQDTDFFSYKEILQRFFHQDKIQSIDFWDRALKLTDPSLTKKIKNLLLLYLFQNDGSDSSLWSTRVEEKDGMNIFYWPPNKKRKVLSEEEVTIKKTKHVPMSLTTDGTVDFKTPEEKIESSALVYISDQEYKHRTNTVPTKTNSTTEKLSSHKKTSLDVVETMADMSEWSSDMELLKQNGLPTEGIELSGLHCLSTQTYGSNRALYLYPKKQMFGHTGYIENQKPHLKKLCEWAHDPVPICYTSDIGQSMVGLLPYFQKKGRMLRWVPKKICIS